LQPFGGERLWQRPAAAQPFICCSRGPDYNKIGHGSLLQLLPAVAVSLLCETENAKDDK